MRLSQYTDSDSKAFNHDPQIDFAHAMRTLFLQFSLGVFLAVFLLPQAAHAQFNAYFHATPNPNEGDYTLSWNPPSGRVSLEERVNGGQWSSIGGGTATSSPRVFSNRAPGTYDYRLLWSHLVCSGGSRRSDCESVDDYSSAYTVTVTAPPIPLDDEWTQLHYEYESRVGDLNGDGYTDIHILRLTGNPDNGVVYETVGLGQTDGTLAVQAPDTGIYAAARAMPVVDVVSAGLDVDSDGFVDPTISDDAGVTGLVYDHSVLSSGVQYDRNSRQIIAYNETLDKYEDDLRQAELDPTYFDNARTPDVEGFEVALVYELEICIYVYWFPVCDVVAREEWELGFVPLSLLGLSGSQSSSGSQKPGNTGSSSAQALAMDQAAQSIVNDPNVSTFMGTDAEKQVAINYFGLVDNTTDEVYYCVWLCGWLRYYYYDGYTTIRWYDRWTRATREGEFDDVNYSRAAYDTWQAEQELDVILNATPGTRGIEELEQASSRVEGRRQEGWGIFFPFPTPAEILVPRIEEAVEGGWEVLTEAIRIQRVRWKIMRECRKAETDPEACIAALEDEVIGATADGELIGGVWTPEEFDENAMQEDGSRPRTQIGAAVVAVAAAASPGRWQCSYWKSKVGSPLTYFGITSTHAGGNCQTAVDRRSRQHDNSIRFMREGSWSSSQLDKELPPFGNLIGSLAVARQVIRGREQQMIDSVRTFTPTGVQLYGIDAWKYDRSVPLFNLIRSVSKRNILGCAMWVASNANFGNRSPYTGYDECL